ncbi:hypothetical protein [Moorena producens]|uniref:hypothetical protein n=1 Tax=Moorena producens TaxID=1155739 RepID=UPI003C77FD90
MANLILNAESAPKLIFGKLFDTTQLSKKTSNPTPYSLLPAPCSLLPTITTGFGLAHTISIKILSIANLLPI